MRSIRSSDLVVRVASMWPGRLQPLAKAGGWGVVNMTQGREGWCQWGLLSQRPAARAGTHREIGVLRLILWGRKPRRKGNFECIYRGQPKRQAWGRLSSALQRPKQTRESNRKCHWYKLMRSSSSIKSKSRRRENWGVGGVGGVGSPQWTRGFLQTRILWRSFLWLCPGFFL